MKKLLILLAFVNFNVCFAQTFSAVKVYIKNPYVERVNCIKYQMYNMDYVRSHYASCVFSREQNYMNALFDSLQSFPMTEVDRDSISLFVDSYWGGGLDMNFEPCIVIDFIRSRSNTYDEEWTFSVNKEGFICRTFDTVGNRLCYPNKKFLDFLKRQFPGLFLLIQ